MVPAPPLHNPLVFNLGHCHCMGVGRAQNTQQLHVFTLGPRFPALTAVMGWERGLPPLQAAQGHLPSAAPLTLRSPHLGLGFPLHITPTQLMRPCSEDTSTQSLTATVLYKVYFSGNDITFYGTHGLAQPSDIYVRFNTSVLDGTISATGPSINSSLLTPGIQPSCAPI